MKKFFNSIKSWFRRDDDTEHEVWVEPCVPPALRDVSQNAKRDPAGADLSREIRRLSDAVDRMAREVDRMSRDKGVAADFAYKLQQAEKARQQAEEKTRELQLGLNRSKDVSTMHEAKLRERENALASTTAELDRTMADLRRERELLSGAQLTINSLNRDIHTVRQVFLPDLSDPAFTSSLKSIVDMASSGNGDAKAAVVSLSLVLGADASSVQEESLLASVRQFSESYATCLKSSGSSPREIVEELTRWSDMLNARFNGRFETRVPAIGFPVDPRSMSAEGGAGSISEVFSWFIANSKGGVYSLARIR